MQAFISYAHNDYRAFEEFCTCLKPVARAFDVDIWEDKRIRTGQHWNQEIAKAIEASEVHVLLMSNGFFGSDYIFTRELPAIVARQQNGAMTAPVLLERCYWSAFIGVLQAAPMNPKGRLLPINEWKIRRTGFSTACEQIAVALEEHFKIAPNSPFPWRKP
jgi:hypothetical protein